MRIARARSETSLARLIKILKVTIRNKSFNILVCYKKIIRKYNNLKNFINQIFFYYVVSVLRTISPTPKEVQFLWGR